ncbi:hypothetical protein BJ912DRAFT_1022841 [Pholiota molesta]|nr:hypothetical protein BJ912DRAFT_1022841 [Pholiota molesta]
MAHLLRAYNEALMRRPMVTQSVTAAVLFGAVALFGPAMTTWYSFLNRIKFPSPTNAFIYRVCLAVGFFYSSMSVLEGKPEEAVEHAYVPTLIRNWGVFIPTQIITFSLTPPHLRFGIVSIVSLFWNTYLSASDASLDAAQSAAAESEESTAEKLNTID